jgi:hypothetical protein
VLNADSKSLPAQAPALDPLQASAFIAVGGCYILSRQDALIVRYVTAEPGYVSVLRIGARDLDRAEWSH